MKDERRVVQRPRRPFAGGICDRSTPVWFGRKGSRIGVHVGEQERVCMYDCGIVEMAIRSLPRPLARVDVLIRRHEECKEKRETSLQSRQTAHDGVSMYQMTGVIQSRWNPHVTLTEGVALATRLDRDRWRKTLPQPWTEIDEEFCLRASPR